MSRLIIIGNGFDLYHSLPTKYLDFKNYVVEKNPTLFNALNGYFDSAKLWWQFEKCLSELDIHKLSSDLQNCDSAFSSDETDSLIRFVPTDYEFGDPENLINIVTVDLQREFLKWILTINKKIEALESNYNLDKNSKYLSFNYTSLLQKLYNIPSSRIFHIHNEAKDIYSKIVLGHNLDTSNLESFLESNKISMKSLENPDTYNLFKFISDYFKNSSKSSKLIIKNNYDYFRQLETIEEIIILGHSISEVDEIYFSSIIKEINIKKVSWKVSYYSAVDKLNHKNKLERMGVNSNLIIMDSLKNLLENESLRTFQIPLF